MRICLVLGAGSSLANAEHFRPKRNTKTHPPLDYTFFDKIRELGIRIPTDLEAYAAGLPTGSPFEAPPRSNRMEEFLRDLFHDFLLERATANSQPVRAYRQLVQMYAEVLRDTTNWMTRDERVGGPIGRLIAAAADSASRVDIITFNHDLVIENEIYKRTKLRRRWCITQSYGSFGFGRPFLETPGSSMFDNHSAECDHSRPIVIHKMHGSLNWWVRIRGREPTPGVLAGQVGGSAPDVMITRERTLRDVQRVRMRPAGAGRSLWSVWPVIVPPVYAKQSLIESFMPSVWTDARDALTMSDRIVFFGYSLPQADIEAEKTIQRTISKNVLAPWVGIIDPAPALTARFGKLVPERPLRWYPGAETFLRGDAFT
jgi:hypothetical protein